MSTRWHELPQGDREAACSVIAFLVYAEARDPRMTFGSWTVGEALEAACHLAGCPAEGVRRELLSLMRSRS